MRTLLPYRQPVANLYRIYPLSVRREAVFMVEIPYKSTLEVACCRIYLTGSPLEPQDQIVIVRQYTQDTMRGQEFQR